MSPRIGSFGRAGYTLTELLVVLIIISLMVGFGLQRSVNPRAKEAQIGYAAETDLRLIFNAENRYRIDNMSYFSAADIAAINSGLGLMVQSGNFTYRVVANATTFTITATRTGGKYCTGLSMSLTQAGGAVTKGCAVWQ